MRYELGVPYSSGSNPYSPDGRFLAYAGNARDRTTFDVTCATWPAARRTVLRSGQRLPDDRYLPMLFSADARHLLVLRLHQNTEHDLFAVDLHTGAVTHLTPHDGPAKFMPVAWTVDGLYLCTSLGRDHAGLAVRHPDGSLRWLHAPDHDIEDAALSADGRRLVWGSTSTGTQTRTTWICRTAPPCRSLGCPGASWRRSSATTDTRCG